MFGRWQGIVNQWGRSRLTVPRALSRLLAATVFPPRCCLCGFEGASPDLDLCAICREDLPWRESGVTEVVALRYEDPVDRLIRELKYHGHIAHARVLGVLLAQRVQETGGELPCLLVPVPLHPARLRERGFNQAFAIARNAGRMLGIPYARHTLRRVRDTPSQTTLDVAQRHRNVRGAFALADAMAGRRLHDAGHVAIVDDVMTTGSTLRELRALLLNAGVSRVDMWAVAQAT